MKNSWPRIAALALMGVMFFLTLGAWAFSSPAGSSPDEEYHLAKIYCATGDWTCQETGTRVGPCFAFKLAVNGDCRGAVPREGSLTTPMDDLPAPALTGINDGRPEVYSRTMSLFVGETVGDTTRSVRLANSLLAVLMAFASVALSMRRLRAPVALGWLARSVPLAFFIVASVNPSSWAIIGIVALWGPLASFLVDRSSTRLSIARAAFSTVAVLMAIGSRTETPFLVGVTVAGVVAYAITTTWPDLRSSILRLALPAGLGLASLAILVGVSKGRVEYISSLDPGTAQRRSDIDAFDVVIYGFTTLLRGVSEPALGWMDTPMPTIARFLATAVFGAVIVVGAALAFRAKTWAIGVFGALMVGFILVVAQRYPGLQPRYFLPLLMVLTGLILMARSRSGAALTRVQGVLILTALAIVNFLTLGTNLQRYVGGLTPQAWDVNLRGAQTPTWWQDTVPIGPYGMWIAGTATFAIACALFLWLQPWRATGRGARGLERTPESGPSDRGARPSSPRHARPQG